MEQLKSYLKFLFVHRGFLTLFTQAVSANVVLCTKTEVFDFIV
jgi:hypothetical protein